MLNDLRSGGTIAARAASSSDAGTGRVGRYRDAFLRSNAAFSVICCTGVLELVSSGRIYCTFHAHAAARRLRYQRMPGAFCLVVASSLERTSSGRCAWREPVLLPAAHALPHLLCAFAFYSREPPSVSAWAAFWFGGHMRHAARQPHISVAMRDKGALAALVAGLVAR